MHAPKTVFLVSRGSYSDYRIEAAFSTREMADAYCAARPAHTDESCDAPAIEELALDQWMPDDPRQVWDAMSKPGSVEVARVHPVIGYPDYGAPTIEAVSCSWPDEPVTRADRSYQCYVRARDAAHATKIAADRFRQFVAEGGANCRSSAAGLPAVDLPAAEGAPATMSSYAPDFAAGLDALRADIRSANLPPDHDVAVAARRLGRRR